MYFCRNIWYNRFANWISTVVMRSRRERERGINKNEVIVEMK